MRLAWLTDIHLDHVDDRGALLWGKVKSMKPDVVLLTGDIADGATVGAAVEAAADRTGVPVLFVLGNHDCYGRSIQEARSEMQGRVRGVHELCWLAGAGVVSLGRATAIVGHDAWADGRLGNVDGSTIRLNDWQLVADLAGISHRERVDRLRRLGDETAEFLRRELASAARRHRHALVLTHPPPFACASKYLGLPSSADWLPWLVCAAAGDAILDVAAVFPDRRFTVLCGHTHGHARARPRANVEVLCGAAEYGRPKVQHVLEVE
jgi:Icc-related predicted phosphoesterase